MSVLGLLNFDVKESQTLGNINNGCNLNYQVTHENAEGLHKVFFLSKSA